VDCGRSSALNQPRLAIWPSYTLERQWQLRCTPRSCWEQHKSSWQLGQMNMRITENVCKIKTWVASSGKMVPYEFHNWIVRIDKTNAQNPQDALLGWILGISWYILARVMARCEARYAVGASGGLCTLAKTTRNGKDGELLQRYLIILFGTSNRHFHSVSIFSLTLITVWKNPWFRISSWNGTIWMVLVYVVLRPDAACCPDSSHGV
jgi:hypothetical protein